jgi:hypothetical protein
LLQFADDGTEFVPKLSKEWATSDLFVLRLLRSSLGDRSGFGMGDVAQKHEHVLEWVDHPDRAPFLLEALERVSVESMNPDRVRDGVLAVAYLFEHHAADVKDEVAARAIKAVERFAGTEVLQAAVERVRATHAGNRS